MADTPLYFARICALPLAAGILTMAGAVLDRGIAAAAHPDTVVVTADRMIDVIAGRVVDHPQITIVNGRIAAVAALGAAAPADARRVDLPGMTLLPGLIDMHTPHHRGSALWRLSRSGIHG